MWYFNRNINLKLIRHCSGINCLLRKCSSTVLPSFKNYSQDEQDEILDTLLKCAEENVPRYNLNEKRLKNIQHFLKSNPKFTSLDQVLEVNGIGLQTLNKLCWSILEKDPQSLQDTLEKPKGKTVTGLITPPLCKNGQKITTIVGLNIGFNAISWAELNCENRELQDWNFVELRDPFKKFTLHEIYQDALEILSSVPDADVYVMENANWTNLTNSKIPVSCHMQKALLSSSLMALFNFKNKVENSGGLENKLYFLRSYIPARLFEIFVGAEKVSAQNIVEEIFQKKPDIRYSELSIPLEIYDSYKTLDGRLKDNMCQSLLLVIAFTELVLLNNVEAMNMLVKNLSMKKKTKT